jgi:hypothetical protein
MNTRALFLVVASALLAVSLSAQESAEASRGADGGTRFRVAGIEVLPVTARPFSGTDTIEWTHNLEDGSVVTTHLTAVVARDSQGRIYRERRNFVPANTSQQSKLIDKIFYDPNAHTKTTCTVATHQCSITAYYAPVSFTPAPAGPRDNGTRYLTREGLGNNTLDDLNVVGTVETLTINSGEVGNDRPLAITREFWYSPDLQINLSVTRKDPRQGTQVIKLVDLTRSEPDPAMFQVPADFTVQDHRSQSRGGN